VRRGAAHALLVTAAVAVLLLTLCAAPLRAQAGAAAAGAPPAFLSDADFDWTLLRSDGSSFRLAELRGQVLFLNVWASWCAPCVRELPGIEALRDSVPGVEFLAVSPERPEQARAWLEERRLGLPVYFEGSERPAVLGLTMVPTTYVVDRAGAIVLVWRGATEWDRPEARAMLRALRDGPRPASGG
jgi:thiol-disulfide isomerase/thioredoxin